MHTSTLFCRGRLLPVAAAFFGISACATTGATVGSGVGDRILDRPPYYAGTQAPENTFTLGHFPVMYQPGASHSPIFDPPAAAGGAVSALLAEMTAYLDSLGLSTRLLPTGTSRGVPPDVRFGCDMDAMGECTRDETGALGRGRTTEMRLAVGRPSPEWTEWAAGAMSGHGVSSALVITLEVGQYWVRQRGLRGDKEVLLGTDHIANLPWLTSVETPVTVLQVTGARVGPDGRAQRIGAEGVFVRRTRLLVSALGGQELLTEEDVQQVRSLRREDLPGRPLAWQVALRTLALDLSGRTTPGS